MKTRLRFASSRNLIHGTRPDPTRKLTRRIMLLLFLLVSVIGCNIQIESAANQLLPSTPTLPTASGAISTIPILTPAITALDANSPASTPFVCKEDWQSLPVIPDVTQAARALYQQGIVDRNDSQAFSKIGDGEISTSWFFTVFDLGEDHYDLGDHADLSAVIKNFQGSFERTSVAARRGFNTKLILDPSAADPAICNDGESPLDCELRIHNPAIAILSLGTNQAHRPEEFETGMRSILNILMAKHALPILSTKGDNLEGDHRINRTIACLAQEYQIPLWNFWAAIQPLPNHGLQPDLEHLTYFGANDFDDPVAMQYAWAVRNLTALQVLDHIWNNVNQ